MNPRFISNLSCGWIWASRRGHEQIVHLSLKNLNLAYVRVSIRRRTSNAVRLLNLIIKHLLSNLLKPKFHVQPFTPTCMGFKKKARANRAPKAKKVKSDEEEGEVPCDVAGCEKWADKRFGGRSIAIDNAIDVWGDDGLKRDVRRVRICRPCYREWKKAKKDEPDQY